jgi:hypothetical protein
MYDLNMYYMILSYKHNYNPYYDYYKHNYNPYYGY